MLKIFLKQIKTLITLLLAFNFSLVYSNNTHKLNFKQNYFGLKINKNYPFSYSENNFKENKLGWGVDIKHHFKNNWFVSLAIGYKNIVSKLDERQISLFVLDQSSFYITHINYPIYFLIGGSVLYIYPSVSSTIPPDRMEDYKREIGIAIKSGLMYKHTPYFLSFFTLERWRGINRRLFQAVEINMSFNVALP